MQTVQHIQLVPRQFAGKSTSECGAVLLPSKDHARQAFDEAVNKLLEVNKWNEISGSASAAFQLTDNKGRAINRKATAGDYIRINIPGPGSSEGDGFDWVMVENIHEQLNIKDSSILLAMNVRPAARPGNKGGRVAHFFKKYATSTFVVELTGRVVRAGVYGRNEQPNTAEVHMMDRLRNWVIAGMAMFGFSGFQWKKLVSGLLGNPRKIQL